MPTSTQPEPVPAKPKRRWWQYSISSLLVLMGVWGAVLALVVNPGMRHRRAVEFVQSLEGGVRYIGEGVEVYLSHTQIGDSGLAHLSGLGVVEGLWLSDTQVSDVGLVHLRGLTALECLYLNDTRVSDEGVAELQEALPNCMIVY